MKYTLLKDVYLDGEARSAGSNYTISDETLAKALLERGSISADAVDFTPTVTPTAFDAAVQETAELNLDAVKAEADTATAQAEAVTADPTPLESESLEVQNEQVQPTAEQISDDLNDIEAQPAISPTELNIQ